MNKVRVLTRHDSSYHPHFDNFEVFRTLVVFNSGWSNWIVWAVRFTHARTPLQLTNFR